MDGREGGVHERRSVLQYTLSPYYCYQTSLLRSLSHPIIHHRDPSCWPSPTARPSLCFLFLPDRLQGKRAEQSRMALLLPDRDTVRSRGRRRRGRERRDSLGEGCSYSSGECLSSFFSGYFLHANALIPIPEIGRSSPSRVQQSSTAENTFTTCTCYATSPSTSTYTRSRRSGRAPLAASLALVALSTPLHASASPVDVEAVGRMNDDSSRKGKGRASTYEDTYPNTYWNDINSPLGGPRQYSLEHSRLGKRDLVLDGDSPASSSQQKKSQRRRAGGGIGVPEGQSTRRRHIPASIDKRSNTPEGVPSHYEYIDGEWVPSPDWSLNGQNGMRHASSSTTTTTTSSDEDSDEQSDGGPSTRKNHASSSPTATAAIASSDDDDNSEPEVDLGDGESTTLGWAKSTNAILGVDIDTSLSEATLPTASASASSPSSSSHGTLASSSNNLVTRSNMATYTTVSLPPSSTASATATATGTSGTTGGVTDTSSNDNNGQAAAYDFSRDVPNGWVSDGRTAAYAVPVIIGMSVFLALVIFGLILALLRMNKSRKKRRKANLNGGLKLSEEGKAATQNSSSSRPSSPALSTSGSTTRRSMSDSGRDGGGMSTSVQRRTISREDQELDVSDGDSEDENRTTRRRIGRKWTPNLSNGSILRKRRKKIAQLFRRDNNNNEAIQEITIDEDGEDTNNDGQAERMTSRSSEARDTAATNSTSLRRRRSVSSGRSSSTRRGGEGGLSGEALRSNDSLSRLASHTSITTSAHHDGNTTYIRPPSLLLQVDTANPAATTTTATATAENDTQGVSASPLQEQRHIRNDSIDNGDHHAVPIPSIGPPAYMQPSTPAYSRAAPLPTSAARAGGASSSSSANHHLSTTFGSIAVPASGYLSAVSTPGLLSAGMDEKRALLGGAGAGLMTNDASGDAFANQRRFEHLYNSREGEDDRLEQMTGAPAFIPSSTSTSTTAALAFASASASSSSSRRNRPDLDDEESDEAIARRAQQEAIDDHRRELQESLAGHVALSDKEVLSRLRMAASAPSTVVTDDGTTSSFEQSASSPSLSVLLPNGHMQEASAPSLDEAEEEEELQSYLGREEVSGASSSTPTAASSMLPQPPKPFTHALHQIPQVDEKTRLRQAEERQMAASFSPIPDDHHYGPVEMSPSAPPVMNASLNASAPSAPVFDEVDQPENVPSAPPVDMATIPSAPEFVLEDEDENEDVEQRSPDNLEDRPYNEGVI